MKRGYCLFLAMVFAAFFSGCTLMQISVKEDAGYIADRYMSPAPPELSPPSVKWWGVFKTRYYEIRINPGNLVRYAYPKWGGETAGDHDTLTPAIMGQIRF